MNQKLININLIDTKFNFQIFDVQLLLMILKSANYQLQNDLMI